MASSSSTSGPAGAGPVSGSLRCTSAPPASITDITFAKVDTEAEISLSQEFGIRSIPTIMAIRDGIIVFQQAGALPEQALESLIEQVRALDMDEVRSRATAA